MDANFTPLRGGLNACSRFCSFVRPWLVTRVRPAVALAAVMLWCLCLVAAAPIDVPSGIRRVFSSTSAAAALGLDEQRCRVTRIASGLRTEQQCLLSIRTSTALTPASRCAQCTAITTR